MSTTAALLSAIAQAKQNLVENLEAKNVPAYGLTSFTQLAERVLEIPSSLPACPVEEENIPIPQGATYSASLEQLVQARESLRQNLGAKGIDVTGIQALSTLVERCWKSAVDLCTRYLYPWCMWIGLPLKAWMNLRIRLIIAIGTSMIATLKSPYLMAQSPAHVAHFGGQSPPKYTLPKGNIFICSPGATSLQCAYSSPTMF